MSIKKESNRFFWTKRVPLYLVIIISVGVIFCLSYIYKHCVANEPKKENVVDVKCITPLTVIRDNSYKLTHPLLLTEVKGDDRKYDAVKSKVGDLIHSFTKTSVIGNASVYFCSLVDNSQFSINPEEKYHPTNMLEMAKIITLLKQSERTPDLLDRKVLYQKKKAFVKHASDVSESLADNSSYSIRKLMLVMMLLEDENAALALNTCIDTNILKQFYASIQVVYPGISDDNYLANVNGYSRIWKVLYTSGFLNESHSELALELMFDASRKEGILKPISKEVKTIHLLSEHDYKTNKELHEYAIIYLKNKPYLLTIMTKGGERKNIAEMFSSISKIIYESIDKPV